MIIDAMNKKYPLPLLLNVTALAKSSYYCCKAAQKRPSKYRVTEPMIRKLFEENYNCYGYRVSVKSPVPIPPPPRALNSSP